MKAMMYQPNSSQKNEIEAFLIQDNDTKTPRAVVGSNSAGLTQEILSLSLQERAHLIFR